MCIYIRGTSNVNTTYMKMYTTHMNEMTNAGSAYLARASARNTDEHIIRYKYLYH